MSEFWMNNVASGMWLTVMNRCRYSVSEVVLEPVLIIVDYQQGPKTTSFDSLEPLLMLFSVVVNTGRQT
jgi:hypothetical protein